MDFARLVPSAVGHDELNRRLGLRHEFTIQLHGTDSRKEQEATIATIQEIAKIERFLCFSADAHLAIHERFQRKPARVAASSELLHMNYKTNPGD